MNYEQMTVEELEALIAKINADRAALKEQAMAVHSVLDNKNITAAAAKKLATMSDAEKVALMQMIQANAVGSNGAIGSPTL